VLVLSSRGTVLIVDTCPVPWSLLGRLGTPSS
jgi:hypothetical protein